MKASVIVLTYNHENTLAQCLKSIQAQETSFDFEVIIADDASSDGTWNIFSKLNLNPDQFKAFRNDKNLGPSRNFEKALNQSKGRFLAFCEGDDFWTDKDKLEIQVQALEENPDLSMVYGNYSKVNSTGEGSGEGVLKNQEHPFELKDLIDKHGPSMNSVAIRKSAIPTTFPDAFHTVLNPDVFIFAWALETGPASYIDRIMSAYRIHEGGIWSGKTELEKGLIRYSTLIKVFGNLRQNHQKLKERSIHLLELQLLAAKRQGSDLIQKYWKSLPLQNQLSLKAKMAYGKWFRRQSDR